MKNVEYYRQPDSIYGRLGHSPSHLVEEEMVFHFIARILRLMNAFKMKSQNEISMEDVRKCAYRLVSETKNLHG